jgi:hypothetical protein
MVPAFLPRIVKPREQGSGGQDKTPADQISHCPKSTNTSRQSTALYDVTSVQRAERRRQRGRAKTRMVIRPISNRGIDRDSEIAKRRRSMCDQESEWQSMDGMQTLCLGSCYEEHAC